MNEEIQALFASNAKVLYFTARKLAALPEHTLLSELEELLFHIEKQLEAYDVFDIALAIHEDSTWEAFEAAKKVVTEAIEAKKQALANQKRDRTVTGVYKDSVVVTGDNNAVSTKKQNFVQKFSQSVFGSGNQVSGKLRMGNITQSQTVNQTVQQAGRNVVNVQSGNNFRIGDNYSVNPHIGDTDVMELVQNVIENAVIQETHQTHYPHSHHEHTVTETYSSYDKGSSDLSDHWGSTDTYSQGGQESYGQTDTSSYDSGSSLGDSLGSWSDNSDSGWSSGDSFSSWAD